MTVNYRESYDIFCTNGILFNHESPRRGIIFVTRKITSGLAQILGKKTEKIFLGNLEAKRDWGFSPEYIEVMWKMLQIDKPEDFVIGTGESHSVKEFLERAFEYVDLNWESYVEIDPRYYRPAEVDHLQANPIKAKTVLGWKPRVSFEELVKIMVDCDLKFAGLEPIGEGLEILQRKNFSWTHHKLTNG